MSDTVRVVIADDHTVVREGTRQILERADDIEVVAEASDGEEAVAAVAEHLPDVAVLDVAMPRLNGVEATRRIKAEHPEVAVLALTVHDDEPYVFALLDAGAAGYLLKDVRAGELIGAVRALTQGESVLHPAIAAKVLRRLRDAEAPEEAADQAGALSEREHEVLRLAATGVGNAEIGEALGLSPRTVQVHLGHVFEKLGVASRIEAVITALRRGLITLDEVEDAP